MLDSINDQTQILKEPLANKNQMVRHSRINRESDIYTNTMDTVTLTKNPEMTSTYSTTLAPAESAEKGYEMLRRLVTSMLKEQGVDFQIATTGSSTIDLNELSQDEAQELVADDGYFGVEQTSDRIVNFALSLAGDDVDRLDVIKEGVENGFNEALEAFGGTLPDISYKTFDVVMQKLDAWAAKAQSEKA